MGKSTPKSELTKQRMRNTIMWDVVNGCWECTSHKVSNPKKMYPGIFINYKRIKLSRYMYVKYKGVIGAGLVVRHTCDNKLCINPDHLILGTYQDNERDSVERGLKALGTDHGLNKLSEEDPGRRDRAFLAGTFDTGQAF